MIEFCPSAAEWGNVADWVAGLGSVGVGGAALYFALTEKQRADRAEKQLRQDRMVQQDALLNEAIRVVNVLNRTISQYHEEPLTFDKFRRSASMAFERCRESAIRLQQLPSTTPQIFAELETLVQVCSQEARTDSRSTWDIIVMTIEKILLETYDRLTELKDKNAGMVRIKSSSGTALRR